VKGDYIYDQAAREWEEPPDDDLTVPCPQCGLEHPDADGLPVLYCRECGYCCHPNITDGVCGFCGKLIHPEEQARYRIG